MPPSQRRFLAAAVLCAALLAPAAALAVKELPGLGDAAPAELEDPMADSAFDRVFRGWLEFGDGWHIGDMAITMVLAVVLGAVLAYHPQVRRKASTIEELEQPKTFIMYSLAAAVTALVVVAKPAMAFVVFGIGGLMRFRTDVGQAKDTGRVILAAIIGLCCGIKLYVVAVLATAFGWVLTWYLESQQFGRMQVKGLDREKIPRAADAYRKILTQSGCKILGEKKKFTKGMVTFVFNAPRELDRESMEQYFLQAVPEEIRGSVDWDIA